MNYNCNNVWADHFSCGQTKYLEVACPAGRWEFWRVWNTDWLHQVRTDVVANSLKLASLIWKTASHIQFYSECRVWTMTSVTTLLEMCVRGFFEWLHRFQSLASIWVPQIMVQLVTVSSQWNVVFIISSMTHTAIYQLEEHYIIEAHPIVRGNSQLLETFYGMKIGQFWREPQPFFWICPTTSSYQIMSCNCAVRLYSVDYGMLHDYLYYFHC